MQPKNITLGRTILKTRGLDSNAYMYWVSICALLGSTEFFNIIFTLPPTFLKSPTSSRAMISQDKLSELHRTEDSTDDSSVKNKIKNVHVKTEEDNHSGRMVLPSKALTVTFQDLNYFVDTPVVLQFHFYSFPCYHSIKFDGFSYFRFGITQHITHFQMENGGVRRLSLRKQKFKKASELYEREIMKYLMVIQK